MTLKEIASLAGVSPSTVSRVINHPGSKAASRKVEDKIWQIVRETGYIPDISARSLKLHGTLGRTQDSPKAIGCFLARTHTSDPFFSKITRGLEREDFFLSGYAAAGYPAGRPADEGRRGSPLRPPGFQNAFLFKG